MADIFLNVDDLFANREGSEAPLTQLAVGDRLAFVRGLAAPGKVTIIHADDDTDDTPLWALASSACPKPAGSECLLQRAFQAMSPGLSVIEIRLAGHDPLRLPVSTAAAAAAA